MGNQNSAIRYGQVLKPKQNVTHIIDQMPSKFPMQYNKPIAVFDSSKKTPTDLDTCWGPEDLSLVQEVETSLPNTPLALDDAEISPQHQGSETTEEVDMDFLCDEEESFVAAGDVAIEEERAADVASEENRTFELDPDKFKENELQLAEYAIEDAWYDELPEEPEASEDEEFLTPAAYVSREQRNRQHAYMLAFQCGWTDHTSIDILVEILEPSGQAANTVDRLRELIDNGASAEELLLAHQIREHWKESHEFSKHYIVAWERYRTFIITWNDAMKLVRLYNDTPDMEEIYLFLERLLDNWSTDANLDTRQSFQHYLSEFLAYPSLLDCPDLQLEF